MKALETKYKDVLFRSRLEARWAIFFDLLEIKYNYEPECFILSNELKYTPDFYLPEYDIYIEVKPNKNWYNNKHHKLRYNLFEKKLIVFDSSFPCLETVYYCNKYADGISFTIDKNNPIFASFSNIGEKENLFIGAYDYEISKLKSYRFFN